MQVIEKLKNLGSSSELNKFLSSNIDYVFQEFINQKHNTLSENRLLIENYIVSDYKSIKQLDLTLNYNQIFLDILIDVTERLGFSMYFQRLCRIKVQNNSQVSLRNEASSLYLKQMRRIEDFENIQKPFLDKLQQAFEEQEDDNLRVTASILSYYERLISGFLNTNSSRLRVLIESLNIELQNYSFYNNDILDKLFKIDINNDEDTIKTKLHLLINSLFSSEVLEYVKEGLDYLIETNTDYIIGLENTEQCIYSIRNISVNNIIESDNSILGRGVSILTDERQLHQYMYSFGKMHYAKCLYAFNILDEFIFDIDIEIIDWGCGQALASMTFLYFLNNNGFRQEVKSVTLIEPSELAIKRGALHVKKFNPKARIKTINKKLDNLLMKDFPDFRNNSTKLHLFSNILDIDSYSSQQLVSLIKSSFIGLNYFVIISPYITALKTHRINLFVDSFKQLNSFEMLKSEDFSKGEWPSYNCSMVLRMFKVNLE